MSKRILVVDDHADNRRIIRDMLAPTDYEITEVENGEEALAAIATTIRAYLCIETPQGVVIELTQRAMGSRFCRIQQILAQVAS
jgi:CheY-like chemotaxis protein